MVERPAEEERLREKYLDWCSARLADRFLQLTPDEIYELAQRALPAGRLEAGASEADRPPVDAVEIATAAAALRSVLGPAGAVVGGPLPAEGAPTYRALVARVTELLTAELRLPSYREWVEAYRAAPEAYEEELLGFWRNGLG